MSNTPGITITGASGRMGQMLIGQVSANDRVHLVGALERAGHPWVGQDVGVAMGGAALGVIVTDDPQAAIAPALSSTLPRPRPRWHLRRLLHRRARFM